MLAEFRSSACSGAEALLVQSLHLLFHQVSFSTLQLAAAIRAHVVQMVHRANASHVGGGLSMTDLLAVLYREALRVDPSQPQDPERDRFILSKGHCCAALYATLSLRGYFPEEELQTFGQNGSRLMTHISHKVPGVEFSTGSLGHGLGFGCGKALAAKRQGRKWRVFRHAQRR
jgi:transketolase